MNETEIWMIFFSSMPKSSSKWNMKECETEGKEEPVIKASFVEFEGAEMKMK